MSLDPDLEAGALVFSIPEEDSDRVRVTASVINVGIEEALPFRTAIYASSDAEVTEEDTLLGLFFTGGLVSGELIDFDLDIALSDLPGSLEQAFLGLFVDIDNSVREADETNNAAVIALTTPELSAVAPPLKVESFVLVVRREASIEATSDFRGAGPWASAVGLQSTTLAEQSLEAAGVDLGRIDPLSVSAALSRVEAGLSQGAFIPRDAAALYPLSDDFKAFEIPAFPGPLDPFDPNINVVQGNGAGNVLRGTDGSDLIDGGNGTDTLIVEGRQAAYTLTLTPESAFLQDRGNPGVTDHLISIERLDFDQEIPLFGTGSMPLDLFDGPTSLSAAEFSQITELYIAYFNRAPDALGLYYWGGEYARGMTLLQMAENFFRQPETQATYAAVLDGAGQVQNTASFVSEVYNNVLGRAPDAAGFQYWVKELNTNAQITPANFILSIIGGAKFPSIQTEQTRIDQAYLATKADIGAHFAVIKGISDVEAGRAVMALYDGSNASVTAALDATAQFHADALDPEGGDFLFPLIGVLEDPFALI